jgi:DNA primase
MARIKDSTVEAVRQRVDFVAIVEERTPLRKAGSRFTGRCPFHEERTPSFSVNPSEKLYYCFGCGAKGDLITFVRETQALDFVGAVEWLAGRAGITPEYEEGSPGDDTRRRRRDRLYAALDDAATFYERYLWDSPAGSDARDYLTGRRGLGEEICRTFRLGLALGGSLLTRKAGEKGFTPAELRDAGLTRQRGDDYFQRRLLFPLADGRGRVVGFQARRLYDDDPLRAKYVNTPESELFHKGSVVYGLDLARASIAREDRAYVVEGNTDVIALRQAGIEPVVACMGTALTEQQLRELGRFTKRLWLAFDGDAAGEAAALRGMALANTQGFDVKIVPVPSDRDPADTPGEFLEWAAGSKPYAVHGIEVLGRRHADRTERYRAFKEFLDPLPDSPDKQEAWKRANDDLDMTIRLRATGQGTAGAAAAASPRLVRAGDELESYVLAGVIAHPSLTKLLAELTPEHFHDAAHRALYAHLVNGSPLDSDAVGLLAELDARAERDAIDEQTGMESLIRLRKRELTLELRKAREDGLDRRAVELQQDVTRLNELLAGFGEHVSG